VVRAWVAFAGLVAIAIQQAAEALLGGDAEMLADVTEPVGRRWGLDPVTTGLAVIGLIAAIVVASVATYAVMWWRAAAFRVDADSVEMTTGILMRRRRHMRLDRLQSVDMVRTLAARLAGLAELRLTTASGGDSGFSLAYLRVSDAARVRADLLARAAAVKTGGPAPQTTPSAAALGDEAFAPLTDFGDAPARPPDGPPPVRLFAVPPARMLASLALWPMAPIAAAAVIIAIGLGLTGPRALLGVLAGGATSVWMGIVFVWKRVTSEFNFTADGASDGVVLRHGLTELVSQTVPPARVQALRLRQPFAWRGFGWWRMDVNVAGYGSDSRGRAVVVPVGPFGQAAQLLWYLAPAMVGPVLEPLWRHALTGRGQGEGFVAAPRRARWLDPLSVRRRGYAVTPHAVVIRSGAWIRQVIVVPHARTQAISVTQGPWQRALGVATVHIHSTQGPCVPLVAHLGVDEATRLMREQTRRARAPDRPTAP
jgi:putative membrane protein